jgi:hypothetical protein
MADTKTSDLPTADPVDGTELILLSQGGSDAQTDLDTLRSELEWARPSDWPAMPATAANTVHLLAAIFDDASNSVAVRMSTSSGTWSIDWGDGTSTTGVASGVTAEHTYDYADGDLPSATSRGYKVAVVTITADSANLTVLNLILAPTGTSSNQASPWLEMQINMSAATTFSALSSITFTACLCEHINFVATGSVTAVAFSGMFRLEKISHHSAFFSSITTMSFMFQTCYRLRRIDLTGLSSDVTTIAGAFIGCSRLTSLTFPAGALDANTTGYANAFQNCFSLQSINFPSGALSHITGAGGNMFNSCTSLRRMVFPSGALNALADLGGFFSAAASLEYVEFPSALTAPTTIATAFANCRALRHIKFTTGSFASVTNTTNTFQNCGALSRIENCEIPVSFSVASCRLGAAALDEIYTSLPTVTSQTITVTGNPGTSGDDPTIATAKGWTVTG